MAWVGVTYYGKYNYYVLINCIRHCVRGEFIQIKIKFIKIFSFSLTWDPIPAERQQSPSGYVPDNNKNVDDNFIHSKYFDIDEIQKPRITNKEKCLSLFHINACSLSKNFDELQHLLKSTNKSFDVTAITETRIGKDISITSNLPLNNYSLKLTPTESSAGGTLLCIANHLSYKPYNDLNIYKKSELESTFIEVINPQISNIIIGSIYRHPSMDLDDFNKNFLNKLLEKVSKEQKSLYLLGDFNVNLLNYNDHTPINEFLDSLASNSVISYILQPTGITDHSETLIDTIISNVITVDAIQVT